ncbi:MAG TPA: O-antigen ligase family protein [bacterium]|nr:O-antigen ligase family protein [bacterium]HPN45608.1 O-antigen ligase family protein [bacterium]
MAITQEVLTREQLVMQTSITEERDADYQRTIRCILILLAATVIAAGIFFFLSSKIYAMVILGLAVVGLSFYHTPFALMFLFFFYPLEGGVALSQIGAGSRVVGLIVMLSYVVTRFRGKVIMPKSFIPILMFLWFASLSIIWAVEPSVTVEGTKSLLLNIIMIFILMNTIKDVKQMKMLLWALFWGGVIASIMIAQGQVTYAGGGEKMGRVTLGEGTSPNVLGNSILICFLGGFYLFNEKGWVNKLLFLIGGPLMLYAILNTQNRTALGTAVMAPIAAFLLSAKGKYLVKNILGIGLVCLIGYGMYFAAMNTSLLTEMAKERMRNSENNLEESGRVDQWRSGLEFLAQRPFNGWGWRNFPEMFPDYKPVKSAHNNIVAIAGELGVTGLLIWISIYIVVFLQTLKLTHPPLRWLAIAFLVFTLITGMTSTTIVQKGYWYAIGVAFLAGNISSEIDSDDERIHAARIKT